MMRQQATLQRKLPLRDLTRYRTKLVQYQSAIANRIQKLLEQGNIKLASVVSDALGVSAMAMLRALAQGETDAVRMADMAKRQLRKKIPQWQLALEGCLLPHHRWLLREMIEDLDHCTATVLNRRTSLRFCFAFLKVNAL